MKTRSDRLRRLARAEAARTSALETKLAISERQRRMTEQTSVEMAAAIDSDSALSLLLRRSALQRICDAKNDLLLLEAEAEAHRMQMQISMRHHEAFQRRAASLRAAEERSFLEREIQEVLLAMKAKASGKGGMVK